MRTQGSLRVVLNTKIWAAMTVERASQKSIRITAVDSDDGSVRVYLIMVSYIHNLVNLRRHYVLYYFC